MTDLSTNSRGMPSKSQPESQALHRSHALVVSQPKRWSAEHVVVHRPQGEANMQPLPNSMCVLGASTNLHLL